MSCAPSSSRRSVTKSHRVVHQRQRARLGHRLPGKALVADPHVAVVVVAALTGSLGQRHRGSGDHAAAAAGQSLQHGIGVAGIAQRACTSGSSGSRSDHAASVALQAWSGSGGSPSPSRSSTSTRSWVSPPTGSMHHQQAACPVPVGDRCGVAGAASRHPRRASRAVQRPIVGRRNRLSGSAPKRARRSRTTRRGRSLDGHDPSQDHGAPRCGRAAPAPPGTPPPSSVIQRLRQISPCS